MILTRLLKSIFKKPLTFSITSFFKNKKLKKSTANVNKKISKDDSIKKAIIAIIDDTSDPKPQVKLTDKQMLDFFDDFLK